MCTSERERKSQTPERQRTMYWNYDSFGDYAPTNWEDICNEANQKIDAFIEANPEMDDYDMQTYSERLWEEFCRNNEIGGIVADYSDEEL